MLYYYYRAVKHISTIAFPYIKMGLIVPTSLLALFLGRGVCRT